MRTEDLAEPFLRLPHRPRPLPPGVAESRPYVLDGVPYVLRTADPVILYLANLDADRQAERRAEIRAAVEALRLADETADARGHRSRTATPR